MSFPSGQSLESTVPEIFKLNPGQLVFNGRYELRQELGAGGMGVVWQAFDHNIKDDVALKFLPTIIVRIKEELEKLREEVRTARSLHHPCIIGTHSLEIDGLMVAIVMEYVRGDSLAVRLRQLQEDHPLHFFEPAEIADWVRDIAAGLDYLHKEAKVLHRDLKPGNVLIDESSGHARLADFGISQQIRHSLTGLSQLGQVQTGEAALSSKSPTYASPQQFAGKPSTVADDIYNFGVLIYELLTGTVPFFRATDLAMLAYQISHVPPTPIMERRQELIDAGTNDSLGEPVPEGWQLAVMACLAKESGQRPATATEVVEMCDEEPASAEESSDVLLPAEAPIASSPTIPPTAPPLVGASRRTVSKALEPATTSAGATPQRKARGGLWRWLLIAAVCLGGYVVWPKSGVPMARRTIVTSLDDGRTGDIFETALPGGIKMAFCYCPAGHFTMGSPTYETDREENEDQVEVTLSKPFWMEETELTQAQWQAVTGVTLERQMAKATLSGGVTGAGPQNPMYCVSWKDAQAYIAKLNQIVKPPAGWTFALPTEAQWEYACRAGTQKAYAFGDSLTSSQANIEGKETREVGRYPANAWGLKDMHGNVAEWCFDAYGEKLPGGTDPMVPEGEQRMVRGGSWHDLGRRTRSGYRFGIGADSAAVRYGDSYKRSYDDLYVGIGFRPALVPASEVLQNSDIPKEEGDKKGNSSAFQPKVAQVPSSPLGVPADAPKVTQAPSEEPKTAPKAVPAVAIQIPGPSSLDDGHIGSVVEMALPGDIKMTFCYCPAGHFTMGSPTYETDREENEDQVEVTLSKPFWMEETELTQAQWQSVTGVTPERQGKKQEHWEPSGMGPQHPMYYVSWEDAQAWVAKMNQMVKLPAGWIFALPTEAQWEYACRAGTQKPYAFGDSLTSSQANIGGEGTREVGGYPSNAWGLKDMHGNVAEWCFDAYGEKLPGGTDPVGGDGIARVLRGGNWHDLGRYTRSAYRVGFKASLSEHWYSVNGYTHYVGFGFRPALVPAGAVQAGK